MALNDHHRYSVRGLLGRGGMAEVFEAEAALESGVLRRVAIKRLLPGHEADPKTARMFLDEAKIVSQLHHGAIVALFDYGVMDGQPFQVLELVSGLNASSLRHLGDEVTIPMPEEVALHLASEVALALHYAHIATEKNGAPLSIVHRDVKPSNILVSWNGDVKIGDFGIAKALVRTEQTLDGGIKGTPSYMAPEQLRGETLDGRADIFSLGCTLCALLVGASPLSLPDNLSSLLRGEEMELDPDIGPAEAAIIRKAVRPRASDRYATAGDFAEDVGAVLASRIKKSPRAVLMEWLQKVRPHASEVTPPAKVAGKLEGLFELELVLDASEVDGRKFITRTAKFGPKASGEGGATPDSPTLREGRASSNEGGAVSNEGKMNSALREGPALRGQRQWLRRASAPLALFALGFLAFIARGPLLNALWASGAGSSPAPPSPPGASSFVAVGDSAVAAAESRGASSAAMPEPLRGSSAAMAEPPRGSSAATAEPVGGSTGTAAALPLSSAVSPSGSTTAVFSPSSDPSPSAKAALIPSLSPDPSGASAPGLEPFLVATTGFVVVRGPGSVGGEIRVDGVGRGFAPKRLELPLGNHSIDVVTKEGKHLGPRVMAVTERNTRMSPAAWDIAAQ